MFRIIDIESWLIHAIVLVVLWCAVIYALFLLFSVAYGVIITISSKAKEHVKRNKKQPKQKGVTKNGNKRD